MLLEIQAHLASRAESYSPIEKVAVLRRHLLEKEPISKLCDELGLQPTVFHRWQKQVFENGAGRFVEWLDITASKFYDWRERYGKVNGHNGWVPWGFLAGGGKRGGIALIVTFTTPNGRASPRSIALDYWGRRRRRSHSPRAERITVKPPSPPSAQSVQTKKKPPGDLAISP
jgi:hypothetical protein